MQCCSIGELCSITEFQYGPKWKSLCFVAIIKQPEAASHDINIKSISEPARVAFRRSPVVGGVGLPVRASVWLRPQAAETMTCSARASISLGASRRFVSPWPSWPLSLRPEAAATEAQRLVPLWTQYDTESHWTSTHPSSTACPRRWWADYEQHRARTPHSSPGPHSDSRNGEDPRGFGPDYGKPLETHTDHQSTTQHKEYTHHQHCMKNNTDTFIYHQCMM